MWDLLVVSVERIKAEEFPRVTERVSRCDHCPTVAHKFLSTDTHQGSREDWPAMPRTQMGALAAEPKHYLPIGLGISGLPGEDFTAILLSGILSRPPSIF